VIAVWSWSTFWLILHVLSAVIAFGPTFAFPLIASFGQKHPQSALAGAEISEVISKRLVTPAAALLPLFGAALIFSKRYELWSSTWLLVSIPLYIVAFAFSALVQARNGARAIEILRSMRERPPGEAAGPPPELMAVGRKLQLGGMFLTLLFLIIFVLMFWRPGTCFVNQPGC
jgi:uncharacterized membrane protein